MWLPQLGFALALHSFLPVLDCKEHNGARWERCSWNAMLQQYWYLGVTSGPALEVSRLFGNESCGEIC